MNTGFEQLGTGLKIARLQAMQMKAQHGRAGSRCFAVFGG